MRGHFSWDLFHELPVVGILRGFDAEAVRSLARAAHAGGLRTIEVAMNSGDAEALTDYIEALTAEYGANGFYRSVWDLDIYLDRRQLPRQPGPVGRLALPGTGGRHPVARRPALRASMIHWNG